VDPGRLGGLVTPCRLGDKAYPTCLVAFETMACSKTSLPFTSGYKKSSLFSHVKLLLAILVVKSNIIFSLK